MSTTTLEGYPALMTRKDVARALGLSGRTVSRWFATNQFPQPVRLGRMLNRWRKADVEAWLAQLQPQDRAG